MHRSRQMYTIRQQSFTNTDKDTDPDADTKNWLNVESNGLVNIDTVHNGIPNKAGYVITTENGGTHKLDSNTVTVEPQTTEVEVSKEWLIDGETAQWPEGATVEVKLTQTKDGQTTEVAGKTDRLASNMQTVTFKALPKLEGVTYGGDYEIGDVEEVSAGVFKITNTVSPQTPEIEKYVNEDVHADIVEFDKEFTYDIMAYVTMDADVIEITDELVGALEFADAAGTATTDAASSVSKVVVKDTNDHTAGSSVHTVGSSITATPVIDGQKLTVTIDNTDNSQSLRGKWVQVTFNARIRDEYRTLADLMAADWDTVSDNGLVKSNIASHEGITNDASYRIQVGNDWKYNDDSNTVTVKPEETELQVDKSWKDENGNVLTEWPAGAVATLQQLSFLQTARL